MSTGLKSGVCGRCSVAHWAMGVGVSVMPRPAGLSGWLTTARIWCSRASAWSVGRPKAPEPRKMRFICVGLARNSAGGGPLPYGRGLDESAPLQLFELLLVLHPACLRHLVDDEDAIE